MRMSSTEPSGVPPGLAPFVSYFWATVFFRRGSAILLLAGLLRVTHTVSAALNALNSAVTRYLRIPFGFHSVHFLFIYCYFFFEDYFHSPRPTNLPDRALW